MKMKIIAQCGLGLGVLFFLTGCYTIDVIGPEPGPHGYNDHGYDDHDHGHGGHEPHGPSGPGDPGPGYGPGPHTDDGPPEGYAPED